MAREFNLSETAFTKPLDDDGGDATEGPRFGLRWLTPKAEVDLCGHATLASAHALFAGGAVTAQRVRFETRSGTLIVERGVEGYTMDFPSDPAADVPDLNEDELSKANEAGCLTPAALLDALGLPARRTRLLAGRFDFLVEVVDGDGLCSSDENVSNLVPDLAALDAGLRANAVHKHPALPSRGVIVCARSAESGLDFYSRFFAPNLGVPEDPVTGSAHCTLAPHFAAERGGDLSAPLLARQGKDRGGSIRCVCAGTRVKLTGTARTVARGEVLGPEYYEVV